MPLSANLLLAVTAIFCFASIYAIPMGMTSGHQCRCLTTTDVEINQRWLQKMEIVPAGPHCRNTEIM
ncbi:C-X-C motif chemokine 13 [Silurus asotus]|uniref:C-X-C motif chemokine 13 n=1 Tax=Silurus asotus TaxID=30991 RepID=A0AAD5FDU2_SILAS|nr:C-X-C motif chemokine 13 [Silurus asotus]